MVSVSGGVAVDGPNFETVVLLMKVETYAFAVRSKFEAISCL